MLEGNNVFYSFTPTYNRGLKRLYKSLKRQTFQDFVWIVVDDGSTDDTSKLMESILQGDKNFKIVYEKKENGGKHTATDGLTKNIKDVHKKSLRGMRDYDNFLIGCCELPWLERLRAGVNYFTSGS